MFSLMLSVQTIFRQTVKEELSELILITALFVPDELQLHSTYIKETTGRVD